MYDGTSGGGYYPAEQSEDDNAARLYNNRFDDHYRHLHHWHPHASELCNDQPSHHHHVQEPLEQRCDRGAPAFGGLSQSQKTFLYPLNSCTLSWAPIGTQGSVVGCKSEAGVVSTECRWNRGITDFAAYQCREVVTSPESVMSVEKHDACILSLDPAVGMARFSCDLHHR